MVFLTPSRTAPRSERAHATTWAEAAIAIARAIGSHSVEKSLRGSFATIINHFVKQAGPSGTDGERVLNELARLLQEDAHQALDTLGLLSRYDTIKEATGLLFPEETHV